MDTFIERQIKKAAREYFGERISRIVERVERLAAMQGGANAIENYQLLGKRVLITVGGVVIVVQLVSSAIGFVISRKAEEQRVERIVRRILEEERQKAEAEAEAEAAQKA